MGKKKAAPVAKEASSAADSIASIFGKKPAAPTPKAPAKAPAKASANAPAKAPPGTGKRGREEPERAHKAQRLESSVAAADEDEEEEEEEFEEYDTSDADSNADEAGEFRPGNEQAAAMTLNDDAFFGDALLKPENAKAATSDPQRVDQLMKRRAASSKAQDRAKGVRVVTEDALVSMTHGPDGKKKRGAGRTPFCPFDCNCCY